MNTVLAHPVAGAPVALAVAEDVPNLSTREAARILGVSKSTIATRRRKAAEAAATRAPALDPAAPDVAAALQALALLLPSLLGSNAVPAIRLPQMPAADPTPVKPEKPAKVERPVAGGTMAEPETRTMRRNGRRFILSSAQNNSFVHADFLASLETMARHTGAEIIVSCYTYNKNAWEQASSVTKESEEVWFADELQPYLCRQSTRIAEDLVFCAELDRLPTAVDPLSGLDSYTRDSSGVVGHPKVAMKSLAVMKGAPPRFMYSTGTVTQRNYVDRLAGQKAAFHHTFAALFVEVDEDGAWFARQLVAGESGEFQDLGTVYTPHGVRQERVAAIVYGDLHAEKMDDAMADVLWGQGGIRDTLRPEVQVLHDAGDFTARNHHNVEDGFFLLDRHVAGQETVEGDMRRVADLLSRAEHEDSINVIADANHQQQALMTWLCKADIRKDPANKRYFHRLSLRMCEAIEDRETDFSIYEWVIRDKAPLSSTRFLRTDESYEVCGIELGIHGHLGPNGARGSPKAYRQLGKRAITAHTHSAGIVDGVWTAGVSGRLDMTYNKGPSSWSQSHVVVYGNGKRAIITHRGDRWRGAPWRPRFRVKAASSCEGRAAA